MSLITNREPSYSSKRTSETIKFCNIPKGETILDIAAPNELSKQMAVSKGINVINTISDLDYDIIPETKSSFKYVTCFEVIEHLMNPRLFFDNLHQITDKDVILYLSYPSRPKIMWNNEEHFHEYDRLRFNYLLEKTSWKVIGEKKIYVRRKPNGIRPLIRNFIPQTIIYELHKI
jgi:hypothetical protein